MVSSSRPTVLTQHTVVQKCTQLNRLSPRKIRWGEQYSCLLKLDHLQNSVLPGDAQARMEMVGHSMPFQYVHTLSLTQVEQPRAARLPIFFVHRSFLVFVGKSYGVHLCHLTCTKISQSCEHSSSTCSRHNAFGSRSRFIYQPWIGRTFCTCQEAVVFGSY